LRWLFPNQIVIKLVFDSLKSVVKVFFLFRSESAFANEMALAQKQKELDLAYKKIADLTAQLANVIDRFNRLVVFKDKSVFFKEDALFIQRSQEIQTKSYLKKI
jgi:hypothetical protein